MKNHFVGPLVAIVLTLAAHGAVAVEGDTKVTLCKYCNSSAFSNAAETAAMQQAPQLQEGRQFVFVVDVGTDEIRYYEVVREYVQICREDTATAQSSLIIDPGQTLPDCFSNWVTSSTQLAPPAATVAELREAGEVFDKFMQELQDFDVSELPIGVIPLDSATDLIGPRSDSHDPEHFRNALQNALSRKVFDIWTDFHSGEGLTDLGRKMFGKRLDLENMDSITINFPDGTRVEIEVIEPVRDEFGDIKGFKMKVDITTAAGDRLPSIPTTAAGFISDFHNRFRGDPLFIDNLSDLFVRVGGRVGRGPSRNDCFATLMCWVEDGVQVCQKSTPDPQLSEC